MPNWLTIVFLVGWVWIGEANLRARGSPSAILHMESGRGNVGSIPTAALSLWCQAIDERSRSVIRLKSASFRFGNHSFPAVISPDSYNATLFRENCPALDTGIWKCDLHTDSGNTTGNILVHVRPIVYSNTTLRVDDVDGSKFHYAASTKTVVDGEKVSLVCPVYSYPKPEIVWQKDGKSIQGSGFVLELNEVSDQDAGIFRCIATNTIAIGGFRQQFQLVVERRLRIKSRYSWLLPLSIIILIAVVLIATIVACEFRKKKSEQRSIIED